LRCLFVVACPARGAGGVDDSDHELICPMVAQMLLGIRSERRVLPIAGWRLSHVFPRLPSQTTYNERRRGLAPKLVLARIVALCVAIHLNWQLGRPPEGLSGTAINRSSI